MKVRMLAATALLVASPALADGGITVQLPDISGLSTADARALISELANVNVITSNCEAYPITMEEWTLITGTGDLLAARLGLNPTSYDRIYYGPAFRLLDDPGACDRIGPTAAPLIQRLVSMGGGLTPLTQSQ